MEANSKGLARRFPGWTGHPAGRRGLPSILALTVLLALAACATPSSRPRKSIYVGAGVAYGLEHFDLGDAEHDSGLDLRARDALGGDLRLGLRVHPQAELELQAQAYGAFEVEAPDGSASEVDLRALTCNLKLYDPLDWFPDLDSRWRPYLVLGLGTMQAELGDSPGLLRALDDTAAAGRAGVGLEAFVSGPFAWFAEASLLEPFGDLEGLTVVALSAGVQWRF